MLTQTAEMATLSNAAPPLLSDAACPGLPPHSCHKASVRSRLTTQGLTVLGISMTRFHHCPESV